MTLIEPRVKHGDASDGSPASGPLGRAIVRTDGPLKVQGAATYALEHRLEGLLHCVIVQSDGWGRADCGDRPKCRGGKPRRAPRARCRHTA